MPSKLTQAEIPMCPYCGHQLHGEGPSYRCPDCGEYCGQTRERDPDWGYHKPDVSGVVQRLRGFADRHDLESPLQSPTYTGSTLRLIADALADRLEGKDTEENHG